MRHALTPALCAAILVVMALIARQQVSRPMPAVPGTPGVVHVTAFVPFHVADTSGIALLCVASQSADTFPPMLKIGDPSPAPSGGISIPTGATHVVSTTYAPGGGTQ